MFFYLGVFVISLAFCAVACLNKKSEDDKPKPFFFILSGVVLVLLLSLRDGVGTDYYPIYVDGFNLALHGQPTRFEMGYDLLQRFAALLSDSHYFLFFLAALITIGLTYLAVYRMSLNPVLSLLILLLGGFFFFSTNAVRQCIAEAIFLNALYYLFKKEPTPFILLTLLAATFHTAALCYLPLYFFVRKQLNPKMMIVAAIVIFFAGSIAFDVVYLVGSFFSPQFARYSNLVQYFTGDFDIADFAYFLLGLLLWMFVRFRTKKDLPEKLELKKKNDIYASILFVGLLFTILSLNAAIMFRVARLFTPLLILAIPSFLQEIKGKKGTKLITAAVVVFFFASAFYLYGYLNFDSVIPYTSIFE